MQLMDLSQRRPRDVDHERDSCDWHDILLICNTVALTCVAFVVAVVLVLLILWHV